MTGNSCPCEAARMQNDSNTGSAQNPDAGMCVCVCVCLESGSAQTARLESDIILKILTTLQMLQLSVPLTLLFLLNNIQLVDLSLRCFSFEITQPFKHYVILDKFTQYIIFFVK